jgi:hypothetical protein
LGQPSSIYFPTAVVRGIVGDARERGLDHEPVPTIYYCGLIMQPGLYFLARTHGDPMALRESIRRKLHEIEPARSVYDISPLTAPSQTRSRRTGCAPCCRRSLRFLRFRWHVSGYTAR